MRPIFILCALLIAASTSAQTYTLKKFDYTYNASDFCTLKNTLYFTATELRNSGTALWKLNSQGAIELAHQFHPHKYKNGVFEKITVNDKMYLSANDSIHGRELWEYNGQNPPVLIADILAGINSSNPRDFVALNNKLYFIATSNPTTPTLYEYDPSKQKLTPLLTDAILSTARNFIAFNGRLVFTAMKSATGNEPFVFDPWLKAFWMLADIYPGKQSSDPYNYLVVDNKLFFTASAGFVYTEIFMYDGVSSPKMISDFAAKDYKFTKSSGISNLAYYNGNIYIGYKTGYQVFPGWYLVETSLSNSNSIRVDSTDYMHDGGTLINFNKQLIIIRSIYNVSQTPFYYDGQNPVDTLALNVGPLDSRGFLSIKSIYTTNNKLYFNGNEQRDSFRLYEISLDTATSILASSISNVPVVLYPNPVTTTAHLQFELQERKSLTVRLADINGREVYSSGKILYSASAHTIHIPMSDLPPGNYIYTLQDNNGIRLNTGKIAKQ